MNKILNKGDDPMGIFNIFNNFFINVGKNHSENLIESINIDRNVCDR